MGTEVRKRTDAAISAGASLFSIGRELKTSAATVKRHRLGCPTSLRDQSEAIAPSVLLNINDLIAVAQEAMEISIGIARTEQTERPGVATRAAATAAKVSMDMLAVTLGHNKLIELEARIAILAGDEAGAARLRSDLLYPSDWKPPRLVKQPATDGSEALPEGVLGYVDGKPFTKPTWGEPSVDAPKKVIPPVSWG